MNERIRELAEQAQAQVHEIYNSMEEEPTGDFDYWFDAQFQKIFAELIVSAVLDEVNERAYYSGDRTWSDDLDRKWIELEFGFGELAGKQNER
jgi:hypothetical protein